MACTLFYVSANSPKLVTQLKVSIFGRHSSSRTSSTAAEPSCFIDGCCRGLRREYRDSLLHLPRTEPTIPVERDPRKSNSLLFQQQAIALFL